MDLFATVCSKNIGLFYCVQRRQPFYSISCFYYNKCYSEQKRRVFVAEML